MHFTGLLNSLSAVILSTFHFSYFSVFLFFWVKKDLGSVSHLQIGRHYQKPRLFDWLRFQKQFIKCMKMNFHHNQENTYKPTCPSSTYAVLRLKRLPKSHRCSIHTKPLGSKFILSILKSLYIGVSFPKKRWLSV